MLSAKMVYRPCTLLSTLVVISVLPHRGTSFVPSPNAVLPLSLQNIPSNTASSYPPIGSTTARKTTIFMNGQGQNKEDRAIDEASKTRGNVDPSTRKKLLAESIAPWRTIRLFLYAALGSGAALGGFITLTGVLAAKSGAGAREVDMNTEYLNLAIDFGAVALFAIFAKLDLNKKAELDENVEKKLNQKKTQNKIVRTMREREKFMSTLNIKVRVSPDPAAPAQVAQIGAVQTGARQHVIIVIGPRKAIKDALLGANLLKMDFAMSDVLVVPYELNKDTETRPTGSGFGERPVWETQAYVAEPTGDGWDDYVADELKDAVAQSGPMVKVEGVAIVLANNGKVIRRGVGRVPWSQMVTELSQVNAVPDIEAEYGLL